ncbi:MAG: dTDP-4-dehydrorhamnose 3,5-epimerase [Myxococcales bacterium]|nr:dTDP-4-dehydrorhamnose 3,5-epimerase [Myxococcales bacterium]
MEVVPLSIPDVLLVKPRVFGDARGYFLESFHVERYAEHGIPLEGMRFVQDNVSRSPKGILRGLHLQHPNGQGKLVQVTEGAVYDVAVDVRFGSPTFGKWVGEVLDAERHHQLWIPPGFAHGFLVLSEHATFSYKCTAFYDPSTELSLRYDEPAFGVEWPLEGPPKLSAKDEAAPALASLPPEVRLPRYGVDG